VHDVEVGPADEEFDDMVFEGERMPHELAIARVQSTTNFGSSRTDKQHGDWRMR
jgi:hypothetical protein